MSAVLPGNVNIVPPGPQVPETLAKFSGKWYGVSDGVLDHLLVVEKIGTSLEVDAIYAWGVAYQWNIHKPGWTRFKGRFENQKLLLTSENGRIRITYRHNSDGTLDATYERPGVVSYTTLARIPQ